jgi:hypothetical protein
MVDPAASATGETAGPYRCLAPQTWSVLDVVRTDLRTVRLAIAAGKSDRSDRSLHPSQVAASSTIHPRGGRARAS